MFFLKEKYFQFCLISIFFLHLKTEFLCDEIGSLLPNDEFRYFRYIFKLVYSIKIRTNKYGIKHSWLKWMQLENCF